VLSRDIYFVISIVVIPREYTDRMGRLRRKRMHKNIKDIKRKFRTRRRTKDIDQIHEDMKPANAERLLQEDPDLPGSGQHYCISCA